MNFFEEHWAQKASTATVRELVAKVIADVSSLVARSRSRTQASLSHRQRAG